MRPPRLLVFGTAKSRKSPPCERRRPPAGKPPTTGRPQGGTRGLLQHLAARSRPLACLGPIRSHQRKPTGSTRLRVNEWAHVRELKNPAATPECRRSAASGMRRTIAPLPVDHQHLHSQHLPHEAGHRHVSGRSDSEGRTTIGSTRLRVASSVTKDHVREQEPRWHTRIFQERRAIGMLTQSAVSTGTASRPRR